jgi:hypothetical protein
MAEQTKVSLWATIPPWILAIAAIVGFFVTRRASVELRGSLVVVQSQADSLRGVVSQLQKEKKVTTQPGEPQIVVTRPPLRERNSWDDPTIRSWLAHPTEKGGTDPNDCRFPLEGRVSNLPSPGFVHLWVVLPGDKAWDQGKYELRSNGDWSGKIWLRIGAGENITKTIRVELYEGKGASAKKVTTYEAVIE